MGKKSKIKKEKKATAVEVKSNNKKIENVKKKDPLKTGLLVVEGIVSVGLLFLIFNKNLIELTTIRSLMWWVYLIVQVAAGLFIFKKEESKYKFIYQWEFTLVTLAYIIFASI